MRILVLNYEFPPIGGGGAPVSYELARGYANRGHDVDVVTARFGDLPTEEVVDGMRVYRLNCLRRRKELSHVYELLSFVLAAKCFFRWHLRQHRYDVCHAHFIVPTGLVALHLKKKYGVPYVITAHGSDVPGYNDDRFTWLHLLTPPLLRRVCNGAALIVTASDYLAELIRARIRDYPAGRIVKIPNGIDALEFVPLDKKNIILATGRLLPRKGFQHLIKAVSDVDLGFDIHICGDGPTRTQLLQLADESQTRIIFHGWVDARSDLYRELLGTAAIFVLPSTQENASVSLLEAMSAGCAVVTSDVPGCLETLHDSGVLINPKDTIELRDCLLALTRNAKLCKRLQRIARQRIETVFAWDRIVEAYEEELSGATSDPAAPQPHGTATVGDLQEPQVTSIGAAGPSRPGQIRLDSRTDAGPRGQDLADTANPEVG